MRATQFAPLARCAILVLCSGIAVPLCVADCGKTGERAAHLALAHTPTSIQMLAKEIQGKKEDEVSATIVKRFGPAARSIGSGIISPQWDVESGVLDYREGLVSFRAKGSKVVWLTATINKALLALTTDLFEMTTMPETQTKYWLGDLRLKPDSTYEFVDSGQSLDHRTGQKQNFFMTHPGGRFETHFAPGCTGDTALEDLADGTFLCSLTFLSTSGGPQVTYDIIVYPNERRLAFSTKRRPLVFLMDKRFAA